MSSLTAYFLTSIIITVFCMFIAPLVVDLDPPDWALIPFSSVAIAALVSIPVSLILMVWSSIK